MVLSVIMPSLNVASYIDQCVQSVISQTFRDIEILCIDAGSTDGTCEKLIAYSKKEYDGVVVRYIHSPEKSYGYQVNLGVQEAKGKYIGIVETDDYVSPDMYGRLVDIAEKYECDYVKADYDSFFTVNSYDISETHHLFLDSSDLYDRVIDPSDCYYIFCHDGALWKGIYSRRFLLDNNIKLNETRGAAFQDVGFAMQVFSFARRAYYIKESFYRYRTDNEEASSHSPQAIKYLYQELNFLLSNPRWGTGFKISYICNHIAACVVCEFQKLMFSFGLSLEDASIRPYFDLLCGEYRKFMEEGLWPNKDTEPALKESMLQILNDTETFISNGRNLCARQKSRKESFYSSLESTGRKNVIIFGAGAYGKSCCKDLLLKGFPVVAFCDNNESLWETDLYGIKIVPPKDVAHIFTDNHCLVIANKDHSADIRRQLEELGVAGDEIHVYGA